MDDVITPAATAAANIRQAAAAGHDWVVGVRRALHRRPELAFKEVETAARITAELNAIGADRVRTGVAKTGIIAEIDGSTPGPLVILRADIDALPIHEENTFAFRSEIDGCMHACGHDGHTASLLGAARILSNMRPQFAGTVRFLFQPSEEKLPGGAPAMIADGALDGNDAGPPLAIFGQHVRPSMPSGTIGIRPGAFMASADELYVTVRADGGHAAEPHLQNADPVLAAAHIVVALQSVISRVRPPGDPGVLSIGRVIADGATNVIPPEVRMEGTLRAMSATFRNAAHEAIRRTVTNTAAAMGATASVEIKVGYPALINDPESSALVRDAATEYVGADNVLDIDRWYAAEDFAYYLEQLPGAFYMLGIRNEALGITSAVHTPTFTIDEPALETGAGFMAYLAIRAMKSTG